MKGIENISRSIVDEAKAKAEQNLEEARQQAARIGEKAAQQAQAQEESLKKDAQTRAEELLRRSERTALLENKKGQLAARRQQIFRGPMGSGSNPTAGMLARPAISGRNASVSKLCILYSGRPSTR